MAPSPSYGEQENASKDNIRHQSVGGNDPVATREAHYRMVAAPHANSLKSFKTTHK